MSHGQEELLTDKLFAKTLPVLTSLKLSFADHVCLDDPVMPSRCLRALASCPRLRVLHLFLSLEELPVLPSQLEEFAISDVEDDISPVSCLTNLRTLQLSHRKLWPTSIPSWRARRSRASQSTAVRSDGLA